MWTPLFKIDPKFLPQPFPPNSISPFPPVRFIAILMAGDGRSKFVANSKGKRFLEMECRTFSHNILPEHMIIQGSCYD